MAPMKTTLFQKCLAVHIAANSRLEDNPLTRTFLEGAVVVGACFLLVLTFVAFGEI
jgi:hypothetical protein